MQPFKTIKVKDDDVQRFQDNVAEALSPVLKVKLIDGQLLSAVELSTGTVTHVAHGLKRKLQGWIIVGSNAGSLVWDVQSSNTSPDKFLNLNCSANVTVNLWVF